MIYQTPSILEDSALVAGGIAMGASVIFGAIALLQTYCEHHHVSLLREASVPVVFGILIGLIALAIPIDNPFNSKIFFFLLLPIIVFKEGYSLNKQHFVKNIYFVILYGVLGTILNFLIVLGLTYAITQSSVFWPSFNADEAEIGEYVDPSDFTIFFSACVTSKDSAVSLSVLEFEHAPKLNSIIFGEQIINDVIVFALSNSATKFFDDNSNMTSGHWYNVFIFIGWVLAQILVGLVVGVIVGMIATWITKKARFITEHSSILTAFTVYVAYFAFSFCEAFEFCGVMAVLICGIMMSHYQTYNLPKISASSSKITIKALAYVSETFMYFYVGFTVVAYEIDKNDPNSDEIQTGFTNIYPYLLIQFFFLQPIAKLISMLLCHGFAYLLCFLPKEPLRINRYEFFILFYSGLIKGVVAYALISEQYENFIYDENYSDYFHIIDYTTICLVVGTTLFIGGTLKYVTEWCYYRMEVEHMRASSVLSEKTNLKQTFIKEDIDAYEKLESKGTQKWISYFDENYIKPLLIYNYNERKEYIKIAKKEKKNHHNQEKEKEKELQLYDDSVREKMEKKKKKIENELSSKQEQQESHDSLSDEDDDNHSQNNNSNGHNNHHH